MKVLTVEEVRAAAPEFVGKPIGRSACLSLSSRGYKVISDLGLLGTKESPLLRLDLSGNELTRLTGLHNASLVTWLNVSKNKLTGQALADIANMKNLSVLNAANNAIATIPSVALKEQRAKLKALILNNNRISDLSQLPALTELNSLILSHNKLKAIQPAVLRLQNLTKLSMGHNDIDAIPDLSDLEKLCELRLNDNKIAEIPATLGSAASLKILDLGFNKIADPMALAVLKALPRLSNVNLKGNPLCEAFEKHEEYVAFMKELCPKLAILDGKNITDKRVSAESESDEDEAEKPSRPATGEHKRSRSAPEEAEHTDESDDDADRRIEHRRRDKTRLPREAFSGYKRGRSAREKEMERASGTDDDAGRRRDDSSRAPAKRARSTNSMKPALPRRPASSHGEARHEKRRPQTSTRGRR